MRRAARSPRRAAAHPTPCPVLAARPGVRAAEHVEGRHRERGDRRQATGRGRTGTGLTSTGLRSSRRVTVPRRRRRPRRCSWGLARRGVALRWHWPLGRGVALAPGFSAEARSRRAGHRGPRGSRPPRPRPAAPRTAAIPNFSRTTQGIPGWSGCSPYVRLVKAWSRRGHRRVAAGSGTLGEVRELGPHRELGRTPQDRVDVGVDDLDHPARQLVGREALGVGPVAELGDG